MVGIEGLVALQVVDISESIDDRVSQLLVAGTGVTLAYNDGAGTLTISASVQALPKGHLFGLETSRPTTTSIAVTAGQCRSDTDNADISLASAITKTQAAWAVGSSQGGLDSGSSYSTSTWYYVYAIKRTDTGVCDVIFSTSKTSPTLPTSYDAYRRIGAFYVNSGGTIDKFFQVGDWFFWAPDRKQDLDTTSPPTTWTALTVSVPPILGVIARIYAVARNTATNATAFVGLTHGAVEDPTQRFTGEAEVQNYNSVIQSQDCLMLYLMVNNSGHIKYIADATSDIRVIVNTPGWIDSRGK